MADDFRQMQREFGEVVGLRDTEAQTLAAIVKECMAGPGLAMGGAGAVGMAGAGSVAIPVIGAVPGWLAGFAAGMAAGTFMCTMARRGAVVEQLKQSMEFSGLSRPDEATALTLLRQELFRRSPAGAPRSSA